MAILPNCSGYEKKRTVPFKPFVTRGEGEGLPPRAFSGGEGGGVVDDNFFESGMAVITRDALA